ncbi:MAG: hypothetical protein M3348_06850, partial [Acidobacteriota bacterium]|nr:hypothetical protein [Acidobacteriota bacterium]
MGAGRRPAALLRSRAAAALMLLALFDPSHLLTAAQKPSASPRPLSQADARPAATQPAANPPGADVRVDPGQEAAATAQ